MLRTNLQFTTPDKPLDTLLVTSAGPEEGKSTVTANLAVSIAQTGQHVIAVNADLRRPTLHRFFRVSQAIGLTSVLTGALDVDDALQETDVPGVRVLAAGPVPPNPAELLASESMFMLIGQLRERADVVLFDAPPLMAVTDPGLIAARVDGCLLVVAAGLTPRDEALAAKEQLEKVGARIAGVVLNRLPAGLGYYGYQYYGEGSARRRPWWQKLSKRGVSS